MKSLTYKDNKYQFFIFKYDHTIDVNYTYNNKYKN